MLVAGILRLRKAAASLTLAVSGVFAPLQAAEWEPGYHIHAQVAPDGKTAVYYYRPGRAPTADIRLIELATGAVTTVTQAGHYDANPVFSPDGTKIAFTSGRPNMNGQWNLVVRDLESGQEQVILEGPEREMHPHWSPTGDWISFLRMGEGGSDIWLVRPDGSGLRQLTSTQAREFHPKWAPDGRTLYYDTGTGGGQWIEKIDIDTGDRTVVVAEIADRSASAPIVSPDGRWLAYSLSPGKGVPSELRLVELATGEGHTLVTAEEGGFTGAPAWLPDGSGLVFNMGLGANWVFYRVNRDGSGLRDLRSGPD